MKNVVFFGFLRDAEDWAKANRVAKHRVHLNHLPKGLNRPVHIVIGKQPHDNFTGELIEALKHNLMYEGRR